MTKIEKKISGVMKPVSAGKRLVTAVVACGLLVGVSGCDNHSVLSGSGKSAGKSATSASASAGQRDPDRIYANHDKGVDPKIKHFDSPEAYDEYTAVLGKWGVKQTPDWLKICNQVNVPALRKVGFDPQKDLQNRHGGNKKSICFWLRDHDRLQFFFGRENSLKEILDRKDIDRRWVTKRGSQTYYMGHIEFFAEGTSLNRYDCTLAYERGGHAYLAAFTGKDPKSHKQACDELIDMVSPQK